MVRKLAVRGLITWAIEVAAFIALALVLPGVQVASWQIAAVAVLIIGVLNALLRPLILLLAANLGLALFCLIALILNALLVLVATNLVPGFTIDTLGTAFLLAFGLAVLNTLVSGALGINDDDSFYRNVVRRLERRRAPTTGLDEPGTIFLQIDGLAEPIIRGEIAAGHLPTLAGWLQSGSHRLIGWECQVPSMTSSSQAGILYGNNANIPAFRWYEKDSGRLLVSNHPRDALLIDQRQATDHGLLRQDGSSVGNIFSGGATHCVLTMSRLRSETGRVTARPRDLYDYFVNPYNLYRAIGAMTWEIVVEVGQAWRQRLRRVEPRMDRHGKYRLLRAITCVLLRDLTTWMLVADMFAGRRVAYADYLSYDEVAHHAGPATEDARGTLRKLDDQLRQLESAARRAPRRYRFVVLSDHGQSTGATFCQRYGISLDQLVHRLIALGSDVQLASGQGEADGEVQALFTEVEGAGGIVGRTARWLVRYIADMLPGDSDSAPPAATPVEPANVVVCASGNLALIYFARHPGRISLEAISTTYPGLIDGLVAHPGIGFVLVESEAAGGPVALGRGGRRYLKDNTIVGDDPLAGFSIHTAAFLRRLASYSNVGDIVVNSRCEPETGQVAAFEELIGCHGGAGGTQTQPFLLYPSEWGEPASPILGAEQLHRFLYEHSASPPPSTPPS
jgi:uncharacterized membrane protein YvlD (DUF360 family)